MHIRKHHAYQDRRQNQETHCEKELQNAPRGKQSGRLQQEGAYPSQTPAWQLETAGVSSKAQSPASLTAPSNPGADTPILSCNGVQWSARASCFGHYGS